MKLQQGEKGYCRPAFGRGLIDAIGPVGRRRQFFGEDWGGYRALDPRRVGAEYSSACLGNKGAVPD
jgi:hypothetical protein